MSVPNDQSHNALRCSYAVRSKVIDAAVKLMTKAGCTVSQASQDGCTVLTIDNPPDSTDRIGALAVEAIRAREQAS